MVTKNKVDRNTLARLQRKAATILVTNTYIVHPQQPMQHSHQSNQKQENGDKRQKPNNVLPRKITTVNNLEQIHLFVYCSAYAILDFNNR